MSKAPDGWECEICHQPDYPLVKRPKNGRTQAGPDRLYHQACLDAKAAEAKRRRKVKLAKAWEEADQLTFT